MGQNCDKRHGRHGKSSEEENWKENGRKRCVRDVDGGAVRLLLRVQGTVGGNIHTLY